MVPLLSSSSFCLFFHLHPRSEFHPFLFPSFLVLLLLLLLLLLPVVPLVGLCIPFLCLSSLFFFFSFFLLFSFIFIIVFLVLGRPVRPSCSNSSRSAYSRSPSSLIYSLASLSFSARLHPRPLLFSRPVSAFLFVFFFFFPFFVPPPAFPTHLLPDWLE